LRPGHSSLAGAGEGVGDCPFVVRAAWPAVLLDQRVGGLAAAGLDGEVADDGLPDWLIADARQPFQQDGPVDEPAEVARLDVSRSITVMNAAY
jgi:hypothetical protein